MNPTYTLDQLYEIMEQAMIFQCACPSQLCKVVANLIHLYEYQSECADKFDSENDILVHSLIAAASKKSHAILEECLTQILELEGWDNLIMPDTIKQCMINEIEGNPLIIRSCPNILL